MRIFLRVNILVVLLSLSVFGEKNTMYLNKHDDCNIVPALMKDDCIRAVNAGQTYEYRYADESIGESNNSSSSLWSGGAYLILLVIIGLCLYFIPTLVAVMRNHNNSGAIFALNIFLGWTLIGWVISLVWSLTSPPTKEANSNLIVPKKSTVSPLLADLEKLSELRDKGILTQEEFENKKKKILES